jgi:hypothetical protein
MTIWKPVLEFQGLEASDDGRIRRDGVELPQYKHPGGYRKVQVAQSGHNSHLYVHRLVALAFIGQPTGPLVRHLDGNPAHNVPANLAWGNTSENLKDAVAHGTYLNGAMQKTHCPQNHPYDEANTYITPKGWRSCRTCLRRNTARYRASKRSGQ